MDRLRLGGSLRALRIRLGWRQSDLATAAGVSRAFVSKVERGLIRHSDLDRLERVCQPLGADLDMRIRWRGEALDRLLDEAHAALVDRMVGELRAAGWDAALEVTFNEFGDRGSVDIAGWHPGTRSILIVEVKSVVADAQGTLLPLDRKTRLGPKIGRSRGWAVESVSKLLVIADGSTNRGRVARLASMFDAALPVRNREVRRWLRSPGGAIAGLLFLPDAPTGSVRRRSAARQRVNRPAKARISPG
jgi:transcriptional regulator with XRE-family HTH domain